MAPHEVDGPTDRVLGADVHEWGHLGADLIGHQRQQLGFVAHVIVERGRLDPEPQIYGKLIEAARVLEGNLVVGRAHRQPELPPVA